MILFLSVFRLMIVLYIFLYVQGKTVEVGRAHFETEHTRFTILDAPVFFSLTNNHLLVIHFILRVLDHSTSS
jgi:hypothetical protein